MTQRLPLFPLGTVLFPGVVLPLHIFEDRYRRLVRDLLAQPAGAPRRFGVIAIKVGHEVGEQSVHALHEVGCAAELHKVEAYDDGRFDIVATGGARFRLGEVDRSLPYTQAEVDFLDETAGVDAEPLTNAVAARFRQYQTTLRDLRGQPPAEPPDLPDDPIVLSYLVAAAMITEPGDKQALLAAADAAERLRLERELLRREIGILSVLPSLPAVDLLRRGVSQN